MAGRPRLRGGASRRAPAPAAAARRGRCAPAGRAALAFPARRQGGTAPSRRGRSACGRSRSSRRPCGRGAAPRPRSGPRAPRPGGFPARPLRPLDVEVDAKPRAEVAADALVAIGRLAKAVVDVQRVNARRPDRTGQPRRRAGRIGAAGNQHHPGGDRVDEPAPPHHLGQGVERIVCAHAPHAGDLTRRRGRGSSVVGGSAVSRALASDSRGLATNSSTGCGKPFRSTSPIGSNSR